MSIPHRLNAGNRFERPETQSIKRVVFLSVEGEVTERRYFEFVRESRETLGIKSVVEIHVLRRGDSSSSPEKVVELLENYLEVRNNNDFLAEVDNLELKHYDKEFIHKYLEPIYETMPGWKTSLSDIRKYEDLPENAKKYIAKVEDLIGAPIGIISVGPDREQTIFV